MQILLEIALQRRVLITCLIDNMQTIQAVTKGYSKKLRHLSRTQRICIGMLHEVINDPELSTQLEHCPTAVMKADIFTKALIGPKFETAVALIGLARW